MLPALETNSTQTNEGAHDDGVADVVLVVSVPASVVVVSLEASVVVSSPPSLSKSASPSSEK
jgi:hypothetical protein